MNYCTVCHGCPQSVWGLKRRNGYYRGPGDRFSAVEDETPAFNHSWLRRRKRISQEKDSSCFVQPLSGDGKSWLAHSQFKYFLTAITSLMSRVATGWGDREESLASPVDLTSRSDPASYRMGTSGSLLWVMWQECYNNHSPPSNRRYCMSGALA